MKLWSKPLLTLTLALLLAGCAEESAESHLAKAREYLAAGEQNAAVLELKTALQKDQNLAEARWLLGSTYLNSGDPASAEKELQRAMWLDWDPEKTLPAYAMALAATGKYADALKLSAEGLTRGAQASLYVSQALAKIGLGENQDASDLLDQALAVTPADSRALLAKAELKVRMGDLENANAAIDTVLEREPDSASAWLAKAELNGTSGDRTAAAKAYDKVLELEPDSLTALRARALLGLDEGDLKTARQSASRLLKASPKDPAGNLVMGVIDIQDGRYERAVKRLVQAEPIGKDYPMLAYFLGSAHLSNGNIEQAAAFASKFYAQVPGSIRGRKLLATVRLREENYAAVEELLRPVVNERPDEVITLKFMAHALLRQGKNDEGIELLSRIAKLEPESAEAQVSLGAGLLLEGRAEDAAQHISAALELDPQFRQGDMLLVLSHVQRGDFDAAMQAAQSFAERNPEAAMPRNLIAWVHARDGNMEASRSAYESVLEIDAGDPGANHALAQFDLAQGKLDAAAARYNSILATYPENLPAQLQLASIDARRDDSDAVIARLEKAIETHPKTLEPRLMLARHYLSEGRPDKVSTIFLGLPDAQRQQPAVLQVMALAQLAEKEHSQALFTLEQLSASDPTSADAHYLKAMAAAGNGDADRAERELDRALELQPAFHAARLARAKLRLQLGRATPFEEDLSVLIREVPDNADVFLLQAAAAALAGDAPGALGFAQRAYQALPATSTVLALGSYLERAGDMQQAQNTYQEWLETHPKDVLVRMKLANNSMALGQDATQQYRRIIEKEADNVIALNNLAWLLRESAPEEALDYARRAGKLEPGNSAVLDTLAVVEYLNGNLELAGRTIRRALELAPEQPSMLYHSAMIAAARGATDEALQTLTALLDGSAEFPEHAEAQALYASLKH
ncbi:MAG: PEP-CTERM system TPR-repeat protein PrsT [Halioglobus sp.]